MPFQKQNKLGFTSNNPMDKTPICLKLKPGVRDRLRAIPDWQAKLRMLIDDLIEHENKKPS